MLATRLLGNVAIPWHYTQVSCVMFAPPCTHTPFDRYHCAEINCNVCANCCHAFNSTQCDSCVKSECNASLFADYECCGTAKGAPCCSRGVPLPPSTTLKNCLLIGDSVTDGLEPLVASKLKDVCQVQLYVHILPLPNHTNKRTHKHTCRYTHAPAPRAHARTHTHTHAHAHTQHTHTHPHPRAHTHTHTHTHRWTGLNAQGEAECFNISGSESALGVPIAWDVIHYNEGLHSLWPRVNTSEELQQWGE
jgi:hypothetical protein